MQRNAVAAVAIVFAVLLIAPAPSPLHLVYVTSDSMEPTLSVDDGVVLVSTGNYGEGDVVTFWSAQKDRFVTHRIVDVTDRGLITKGDGNPSTDQETGGDPVDRSDVLGEAVVVGGGVLVIPGLGWFVRLVQSAPFLVVGAALLVALFGQRWSEQSQRIRDVMTNDDLVLPIFAALLVVGVGAIGVLGATQHGVSYVAVAKEPSSELQVPVGETAKRNVTVEVMHPPFTTTVVGANGATVVEKDVNGSTVAMTIAVPPSQDTGVVTASVGVHPYPSTLPRPWIESLHDVHPWVAAVVTVTAGLAPFYLLYRLLFEGDLRLRDPRARWFRRLGGD